MLFHRPDLAAVRKQRRLARKLSEWTGHNRTAVDILAGCLAVLSTSPVEELIERLASDVDTAIAAAPVRGVRSHRRGAEKLVVPPP